MVGAGADVLVDGTPRNWLAAPITAPAAPAKRPATPASSSALVAVRAYADPISITLAGAAHSIAALELALATYVHPIVQPGRAPRLISGNIDSRIVILCDQPENDSSPAAVLRARMLASIGLNIGDYALTHRLPWPTTGNGAPTAPQLTAFTPFVSRALVFAQPRLILALGQHAAAIAGDAMAVTSARGRWANLAVGDLQVPLLATCHPRLLLNQPDLKRLAWADLQAFAARLA